MEIEAVPGGHRIRVKAQAGSRRNQLRGWEGGRLKVAVTQVAEGGKANLAIAALLAQTLGIAKSRVELIQGSRSPSKVFLISGMETQTLRERLQDGG